MRVREKIEDCAGLAVWLLEGGSQCSIMCPRCESTQVDFGQPRPTNYNGDSGFALPCHCYQGHEWEVVFEFHKGQTFIYINILERRSNIPEEKR